MLKAAIEKCGLVAILRGVRPDEIEAIGTALYEEGFRLIEVPLNSPEPLESIRILRKTLPADCLVGGGTVMSPAQVQQIKDAGGELIVMPHSDPAVINAAKEAGMFSFPGVATATEAFAALAVGADALKMFPAEQLGPEVVKAWRAVIPFTIHLAPVGGVTPENLKVYSDAGATAFGLGSSLYKIGMTAEEVRVRAAAFISAWNALKK